MSDLLKQFGFDDLDEEAILEEMSEEEMEQMQREAEEEKAIREQTIHDMKHASGPVKAAEALQAYLKALWCDADERYSPSPDLCYLNTRTVCGETTAEVMWEEGPWRWAIALAGGYSLASYELASYSEGDLPWEGETWRVEPKNGYTLTFWEK